MESEWFCKTVPMPSDRTSLEREHERISSDKIFLSFSMSYDWTVNCTSLAEVYGVGETFIFFQGPSTRRDILESTPFSLRIQIFPRPNVMGFFADLLFSSLESGLKNICIRRMCVDGSRFRNQKVADSKITR